MSIDVALLQKQLTMLQDIEAIKQVVYSYCDIADDDHNQDRIVSIFTEDGIWEGEPHRAQGHAAIRALFKTFAEQICFSQHNVFNPRIRVDGDTAYATYYFLGPFTFRENNHRSWIIARGEDDLVKADGVWKIKHHRGFGIEASFEQGWPASFAPEVFGNEGWRGLPRTG
jgi:uncharacterized protein (TIGR02246 family)